MTEMETIRLGNKQQGRAEERRQGKVGLEYGFEHHSELPLQTTQRGLC